MRFCLHRADDDVRARETEWLSSWDLGVSVLLGYAGMLEHLRGLEEPERFAVDLRVRTQCLDVENLRGSQARRLVDAIDQSVGLPRAGEAKRDSPACPP